MIGTYVICSIGIWLYNPSLRREVYDTVQAKCLIIDAPESTGNEDFVYNPLVVYCLDDIKWLTPLWTDGVFLTEVKNCE